MKKKFTLILLLVLTLSVSAQKAFNLVSINDYEEGIALNYWAKDYKKYADQIATFLKIDSTYADRNYFRLGIAYLHLGDTTKAKSCFAKGIDINVNNPFNYAGLALVTIPYNQQILLYKKSIAIYQKYDPDYYSDKRPEKKELSIIIPKTMAWVYHNIGVIYYQTKRYDSASFYFRKASKERPDDFEHLIAQAINNFHFNSGESRQSLRNLKSASQLTNIDYRIAALRCLFELKKNNFSQALSYIEETKSGDANTSIVLLLKEICVQQLSPSANFDKNIENILLKDNSFAYIQTRIMSKPTLYKIEFLLNEIEKNLFIICKYYNPQIYPSGGLSNLTFDGQKNTTEKLLIK